VEDSKPPEAEKVDADLLDAYKYDFPDWVAKQSLKQSIFTCNSDVRIDYPFPEDNRMVALWADQDCKDFDLYLTVMLDEETQANNEGYVGADLTAKGCVIAEYMGEGIYACEYQLIAGGTPLGILFQGGFQPIYYTTQWTKTANW